uniref:Uncharacterized protein n=1 Tax=Arundo donax TaxID=35708 RepID=A0A0A9A886_ARUDO
MWNANIVLQLQMTKPSTLCVV